MPTNSNHFCIPKDALVMTAIVLFFTLLIIMVFVWYDLQLQQIQQTTELTALQIELPIQQITSLNVKT